MAFSVYEVVRVGAIYLVCLFTPQEQGVNKPTTQMTSDANDFVNAKSHARENPLLAGYIQCTSYLSNYPSPKPQYCPKKDIRVFVVLGKAWVVFSDFAYSIYV